MCEKNKSTQPLRNKTGMTLVEVLVAMAVLMVAVITFLPLGQSSFQNIFLAGKKIAENYHNVGIIEKLIGNNGANGDYEARTTEIPLSFSSSRTPISLKAKTDSTTTELQSINGSSLISSPESPSAHFSTFLCDSVTAQMLAFPKHIADDFMHKSITLYAVGFHFANDTTFTLKYTPEGTALPTDDNLKDYVKNLPSVNKEYYNFKPDKKNATIANLTLHGDNEQINFTHSPLYLCYGDFVLPIELDAPTVIMVGEAAQDGNFYYYVTSGEPMVLDSNGNAHIDEEHGEIQIVRKVMNNKDPLGKLSSNITLNAAMNDVEWVAPGEGDDGHGNDNKYGYYVMCGDNGQIRRFWKNNTTGNYGWGGDYVYNYDQKGYTIENGRKKPIYENVNFGYRTEVQTSYAYHKDVNENPSVNGDASKPNAGIALNLPNPGETAYPIHNRLFAQNVYSVNAISKQPGEVPLYVSDASFFMEQRPYYEGVSGGKNRDKNTRHQFVENYYTNEFASGWFQDSSQFKPISQEDKTYAQNNPQRPRIKKADGTYVYFHPKNATHTIDAKQMTQYWEYQNGQEGKKENNFITLHSVQPVKMSKNYGPDANNPKAPKQSYTLYCGVLPAVMDLWTTDDGVRNNGPYASEWRGTLGLAFKDKKSDRYHETVGQIFDRAPQEGNIIYPDRFDWYYWTNGTDFEEWGRAWNTRTVLNGHIWDYSKTTAANFSISGICGPDNYPQEDCPGLWETLKSSSAGMNENVRGRGYYPLNTGTMQAQNDTDITVAYLSNPYAMDTKQFVRNNVDLSPSRSDRHSGVYEWAFDDSISVIDSDTMCFEDEDGNPRYFSIAVGYYVGGLVYENQVHNQGDSCYVKELSVPTVMNNGVVYIRSSDGPELGGETNVFTQFFSSKDYYKQKNEDRVYTAGGLNTLNLAVSAGYWRDVYHPLFYSLRGSFYDPNDEDDQFSYLMSHIMFDKQLNCVCWGDQWNGMPEAMWGANDGTLMNWAYAGTTTDKKGNPKAGTNTNRVDAEFQSYKQLKYANDHYNTYTDKKGNHTRRFIHNWMNAISWNEDKLRGTLHYNHFDLALSTQEMRDWMVESYNSLHPHAGHCSDWGDITSNGQYQHNPIYNNYSADKRSWMLATGIKTNGTDPANIVGTQTNPDMAVAKRHCFISPLDTIEDVEYANDTWVAVGVQGLANPITEDKIDYCSGEKIIQTIVDPLDSTKTIQKDQSTVIKKRDEGSWVCVRSWYNAETTNPEATGPTDDNCNYLWHAVQIYDQPNCNITQITYSNGMWYAMGYMDKNGNGEYDYSSDEHAMMFYARDPMLPYDRSYNPKKNTWNGGWRLCDTEKKGYTQAYQNNGNGKFVPLDIDGINSVASRND